MTVAADIMTRSVVSVTPETPVREAADLLAKNRFGSVPVVEEDGRVRGIVTEEDLVMRAAKVHLPRHLTFLGSVIYLENPDRFREEAEKILALTAADLMESNFAAALPEEPVNELASRMLDGDIRRVLVLDEGGKLQGIITRADIVRMLACSERSPVEGQE